MQHSNFVSERHTSMTFIFCSAYKEHVLAKGLTRPEIGGPPNAPFGKLNVTDEHALQFVERFEADHGKIPRLSEVEWPVRCRM